MTRKLVKMPMQNRYAIEIVEQAKRDRKTALVRIEQLAGVRTALEALVDLAMGAPFADLRGAAVTSIGRLRDSSVVDVLTRTLSTDNNWHVRLAAVHSLAHIRSPEAINALRNALDDKAYGVREDAQQLLDEIGGKAKKQPRL